MNCPACGRALTEVAAGEVMVDACRSGCGGLWFDHREIKKLDDANEEAGDALVFERGAGVQVDASARRKCPKCPDTVMMRHVYSPRRPVEVDECPSCGGFWLDGGELARIRTEASQADEDHAFANSYAEKIASAAVASEGEVARENALTGIFRFLGMRMRG